MNSEISDTPRKFHFCKSRSADLNEFLCKIPEFIMDTEIENLSERDLRARLRELDCAIHGNREDLVNRLKWALRDSNGSQRSGLAARLGGTSSIKSDLGSRISKKDPQPPPTSRIWKPNKSRQEYREREPIRGRVNPLYKRLKTNLPLRVDLPQAESSTRRRDYDKGDDSKQSIPDPRHRPTEALCIQNLSRPLPIQAFRQKVEQIADEPCEDFWLDNLRSHCFCIFGSLQASIAVRRALHGTYYPENNGRHTVPLFVDYVPPDEVPEYIDRESQETRSKKRWIVTYSGPDNAAVAEHVEEPTHRPTLPMRKEVTPRTYVPISSYASPDEAITYYETKTRPHIYFTECPLNLLKERLSN